MLTLIAVWWSLHLVETHVMIYNSDGMWKICGNIIQHYITKNVPFLVKINKEIWLMNTPTDPILQLNKLNIKIHQWHYTVTLLIAGGVFSLIFHYSRWVSHKIENEYTHRSNPPANKLSIKIHQWLYTVILLIASGVFFLTFFFNSRWVSHRWVSILAV